MVKISIDDDILLLSFNNFKFTSLLKENQEQKDKIKKGHYGYGAKLIFDYNKELTKLNNFSAYKSIASKFQLLCSKLIKDQLQINQQQLPQIIVKQEPIDDQIIDETINNNNDEQQNKKKSKKVKKRTIDEATATAAADTTTNPTNELDQTKTIKKKKKLKAKRISRTTTTSTKLDTTADLVAKNMLDQSVKSEKLSLLVANNMITVNPEAKKSRLSNKPQKKKKKSTNQSKKKSSLLSKKSKKSKTTITSSTSSLADCLQSTKFEFNESNLLNKTPAKLNLTRLNSIMESNSKTIKAEPKQRLPSIHASGKVKQMVELCEARLKNTSMQNTPSTIVKQQQQQQQQLQVSKLKTNTATAATLNGAAKKLRSSIDERKKKISNSKQENKRQSTKRVNAILNDLAQQQQVVETKINNVKKKLNYQEIKQEPVEHHEQLIISESVKHPQVKTITASSSNNGLVHLLATNASIQQNYKLKHTSSLNSEKKKSFSTNANSNNKFLERNTTPCKTKELDEKRKLELMNKEEKEQKRLQEQQKLLHEKIETAKKKREEKMKKINEMKTQQQEDVLKRKEELEAKQKEAEENKKRLIEEKRKEEFEKQKLKEQQRIQLTMSVTNSNNYLNHASNLLNSAQKVVAAAQPQQSLSKSTTLNKLNFPHQQPTTPFHHQHTKPFENKTNHSQQKQQTFKTPSASNSSSSSTKHLTIPGNKHGTPSVKKKLYENYDINDLESGDDTDDDEEPSKPIPEWAKEPYLKKKALFQCHKFINYTKLFRASSQNEIILENIFKIKRKKFTERSSSAIWNSPPVWSTSGLNGEESFRQLHKLL